MKTFLVVLLVVFLFAMGSTTNPPEAQEKGCWWGHCGKKREISEDVARATNPDDPDCGWWGCGKKRQEREIQKTIMQARREAETNE